MQAARKVLRKEIEELADGVDNIESEYLAYSDALDRIRSQVVYIPSKNAYARASLQSQADLLAAAEYEHNMLRDHMGKGVKKAVKLEKKLVVVLGGYAVSCGYGV